MLSRDELERRIEAANEKFVLDSDEEQELTAEEGAQPVDLYHKAKNLQYEGSKRQYPHGANPRMNINVESAISGLNGVGGIDKDFAIAKDSIKRLSENGDSFRAKVVMQQYMEDKFLPQIEALVRLNSADELLNSPEALKKLDKYAIVEGGVAPGYTEAFIRQLYSSEIGKVAAQSDSFVADAVRSITSMVYSNQIRAAVGKANKIKAMIESGEHSASNDDYEIIQKVALRGQ